MDQSRDIKDCHLVLQTAWPLLVDLYKKIMGYDIFLTCTYRNEEIQQKLYAQGRTTPGEIVTQIDGVTRKSMHNYYPSLAFDVCIDINSDLLKVLPTYNEYLYRPLPYICEQLGLVSGGSWQNFKDWPHIQVSKQTEWLVLNK